MKIMERKYISKNGVIERTRYVAGDNAKPRRGKRRGNTTFRKQEQNFNAAHRRVARILNCNYTHENGLLLTLDYDVKGFEMLVESLAETDRQTIRELRAPVGEIGTWRSGKQAGRTPEEDRACKRRVESPRPTLVSKTEDIAEEENGTGESGNAEALNRLRDAADKQMSLWLRRVKRKFCADGKKIKALLVTSDIDHETGELVRVHHHIVLAAEGISWDLLRREWKNGSVDIRQLRAQADYTPVATYLMRQVRRQPDRKKYRVTQGMEMPVTEERVVLSHAEIKAPAGATVLERSEFSSDCLGQYIRYVPRKQEYRRKRTAEWKEESGG